MDALEPIRIINKLNGFDDPLAHDRKRQVASMMFTDIEGTTFTTIAVLTGKDEEQVEALWEELKASIEEQSGVIIWRFPINSETTEEIRKGIAEREVEEASETESEAELLDKYVQVHPESLDDSMTSNLCGCENLCAHLRDTGWFRRLEDLDGMTLREVLIRSDIPLMSEEGTMYWEMKQKLIQLLDDGEHSSLCEYSTKQE